MTWAVILVAWLATMPQLWLSSNQSSQLGHHDHPAAFRRGLSSLGLALPWSPVQGHVRLGSKARGFWSIHCLIVG